MDNAAAPFGVPHSESRYELLNPLRIVPFRLWGEVTRPNEPFTRILRVATLEDGETIHNAFDRSFGMGPP